MQINPYGVPYYSSDLRHAYLLTYLLCQFYTRLPVHVSPTHRWFHSSKSSGWSLRTLAQSASFASVGDDDGLTVGMYRDTPRVIEASRTIAMHPNLCVRDGGDAIVINEISASSSP